MIPNQHLCKQCLTQYAQELDGLHLQSHCGRLGVYGVSPNIVVYGRLVSKTNIGDVTLKQKDSKGRLTVVFLTKVNKPIRLAHILLIFHTENTFFLLPIYFCI